MKTGQIRYESGGGIATVTIDRPDQRNAVSAAMLRDLIAALGRASADGEVRAVVLTGAGDQAFCAGADLGEFAGEGTEISRHADRGLFVEAFLEAERLGKPLIGCVNGHALGGGLGLALACDLVVAADSATFGTPEITVGLWPMIITAAVVRNAGPKRAMELFMTGKRIDAETALGWGLINQVVPAGDVRMEARRWAGRLTGWSPLVMRMGRDSFYAIDGLDFEAALHHLHGQLTVLSLSDDFREGIRAFGEKRPPHFQGR